VIPTDPAADAGRVSPLATIKPLNPMARPMKDDAEESESETVTLAPAGGHGNQPWRGGANAVAWATVRPEVLDACSVALRRMGESSKGSIAVTSTSRREGRSMVAVGLAATTTTELHYRTVLLDLDLERAAIGTITAASSGPGVLDYLYDEAPLGDCLQSPGDGIEIMTAGSGRGPAGMTFRFDRLAELITELRSRCDVIIADLPPLSGGVAAARIADLFESVTLVVRAGGVSVAEIERTASVLSQRPFVVLNGTAAPRTSRLTRMLSFRE
jgi:Mrp family chromosome partitioning ATPase